VAVGAGCYGSFVQRSILPVLLAVGFTTCFVYALIRAAAPQPPRMQLPFVLWLVALSFALHMVYLPAGLCCFFCLMLCKNDFLLPAQRPHAD